MAQKVLSIKLKYKDKYINYATSNKDFHNKFVIGSSKYLFWQILDNSFPEKFILLKKKGENFILQLHKTMELVLKKGNDLVQSDALKKYISNNELVLTEDMQGYVSFSKDWTITYEFVKPYTKVLSPEEVQAIKLFSKSPDLTPEQKFNRNFVMISFFIAFVILSFINYSYKPQTGLVSLEEKIIEEQMATRIIPEAPQDNYAEEETKEAPEAEAEKATKTATATKEATPKESAAASSAARTAQAQNIFGFDPSSTQKDIGSLKNKVIEATVQEDIVASTVGNGGGATGNGSGNNANAAGGSGGKGGSGKNASVFNTAAVKSGGGTPGKLFSGDIKLGKDSGALKEIDPSLLGGKASKMEVIQITSTPQVASLKRKFASQGIQKVKESEIAFATPEKKAELANIKQYVNINKPQLINLFNQESQMSNLSGSMDIDIMIENGKVAGVEIAPKEGSKFTQAFLDKMKNVILNWRFPNTISTYYSFRMTLIKN